MPQRATAQQHGFLLGKTIFRGANQKQIERRIFGMDQKKLTGALQKRGLEKVSTKEVVDVLTGKSRTGLKARDMARVVQAFQDLGVATDREGASTLVMRAGRTAQGMENGVTLKDTLTEGQFKRRMRDLAVERRAEADAELQGAGAERLGVRERMRQALGRAPSDMPGLGTQGQSEGAAIRSIRDQLREQLSLRPTFTVPKPPPGVMPPGRTPFSP